ncbi:hypothetical protein QJS10_CPA03g01880 [Acorus calamus]|uniref:Uncharacterized protein n=1 Tax=Acorus calamus TaxID=4465 RepID=A0AAV9F7Y2_ACOCL|nr:hypothetical protein QJS10_CPA03g01880 [Acorus calamus]
MRSDKREMVPVTPWVGWWGHCMSTTSSANWQQMMKNYWFFKRDNDLPPPSADK